MKQRCMQVDIEQHTTKWIKAKKKKKELTNDAMNISYTSPPSLNRDIEEKNRK